ncbi:MAG: hypothetical protein IJJ47_01945 [Methanosphaera sp.]|nr:hypothetical protein [Methanosphaera sp.]
MNNDTDNFKTYLDPTNNISIKSYAINNVNDHNLKGADEIGYLIPTMGDNFTENGVQLYNNSSIYSYLNYSSYQILLIKSPNSTLLSQIVQSMNKTEINPQGDLSAFSNFTTLTSNPLVLRKKLQALSHERPQLNQNPQILKNHLMMRYMMLSYPVLEVKLLKLNIWV